MTKAEILKAIRARCLDCCCDQPEEVKLCAAQNCALWPLRFGRDPSPRVLTPKEIEQRRKNLGLPQKKSQESSEEDT